MISAFGVTHEISKISNNTAAGQFRHVARNTEDLYAPLKKSYLPGSGYKAAKDLSSIERRGLRMDLDRKRKAALNVDQPIPGFFRPKKTPISSHAATVARKEVRRARRAQQGLKTSPVKRKV